MKRHTKMMAHHKRHKHRTWRLDVFRNVLGNGDGNGGNASLFKSALDQRDRLMSDRSGRAEQCSFGFIGSYGISDFLSQSCFKLLWSHIVANK